MKVPVRLENRLKRYTQVLSKARAKLRKSRSKRSLGITKQSAKIRSQQIVPEAGSKSGRAGLFKDEGSSAGLLEKEEGSQKTKIVRLSQATTERVLAHSFPSYPRVPAWEIAEESEAAQALYRKRLAFAEMLEKQHEERYRQAFYKGYIEVEVTDDAGQHKD